MTSNYDPVSRVPRRLGYSDDVILRLNEIERIISAILPKAAMGIGGGSIAEESDRHHVQCQA